MAQGSGGVGRIQQFSPIKKDSPPSHELHHPHEFRYKRPASAVKQISILFLKDIATSEKRPYYSKNCLKIMFKFYISLILMMATAAIASDDDQELRTVNNFAITEILQILISVKILEQIIFKLTTIDTVDE